MRSLVDWTTVLTSPVALDSPPPIPNELLRKARMCIGEYGVLKAVLITTFDSGDEDTPTRWDNTHVIVLMSQLIPAVTQAPKLTFEQTYQSHYAK